MTTEKLKIDVNTPSGTLNLQKLEAEINEAGMSHLITSHIITNNVLEITAARELSSSQQRILMNLINYCYDKVQPSSPKTFHFTQEETKSTKKRKFKPAYTTSFYAVKGQQYKISWMYELGSKGFREAKACVLIDGIVEGETQASPSFSAGNKSFISMSGETMYSTDESKNVELKLEYSATVKQSAARIRRIRFTVQIAKEG